MNEKLCSATLNKAACLNYGCYLPAQPSHKIFIGLASPGVGQDGALVLLSLSDVEHGDLVSLTTATGQKKKSKLNKLQLKVIFQIPLHSKSI